MTNFVPLIAGGSDPFGGLAAQQYQWAGLNQRTVDENLRRGQQADETANNWFTHLAEMQQQDNRHRDEVDAAEAENLRKAEYNREGSAIRREQDAEAKRQFDAGQSLREKEFQFKKESTQDTLDKQKEVLSDLGATMAPHVKEAGAAWESAGKTMAKARKSYTSGPSEWEAKLPASRWNAQKNELEQINALNKPVPWSNPEHQKIASEAAADMAARKSAYFNAEQELRDATAHWQGLSRQFGNDLVPVKDENGVWGLHSPLLKKSFFANEVKRDKQAMAAGDSAGATAGTTLGDLIRSGGTAPVPANMLGANAAMPQAWAGFGQGSTETATEPQPPAPAAPAMPGASGMPFMPRLPVQQPVRQSPPAPAPGFTPGTSTATAERRVRVMTPDGQTTGTVPASRLNEYLNAGYSLMGS